MKDGRAVEPLWEARRGMVGGTTEDEKRDEVRPRLCGEEFEGADEAVTAGAAVGGEEEGGGVTVTRPSFLSESSTSWTVIPAMTMDVTVAAATSPSLTTFPSPPHDDTSTSVLTPSSTPNEDPGRELSPCSPTYDDPYMGELVDMNFEMVSKLNL